MKACCGACTHHNVAAGYGNRLPLGLAHWPTNTKVVTRIHSFSTVCAPTDDPLAAAQQRHKRQPLNLSISALAAVQRGVNQLEWYHLQLPKWLCLTRVELTWPALYHNLCYLWLL